MITFKQFLVEAKQEGDRVGIPHLYSHNKPELYSMQLSEFKRFISYLESNGGMITPENSTVTEKVDGMALKVGNDENGFFVRSSYSGKVYEPEGFTSVIKYAPAREAFINSFERIKHLISPIIGKYNCTIQLEWLYSPNALEADPTSGKVSFVVAQYNKEKLGTWSTFIVLNIQCQQDVNTDSIRKKLVAINDKQVKFILPNVNLFKSIDLKSELLQSQKTIANLAKVEEELTKIIADISTGGPGRNKLVQRRRELISKIQDKLLPIQKTMYNKIANNLLQTEGLLGDIEGYVIKAGDLLFKVNSPQFMSTKFKTENEEELGGNSIRNTKQEFDNNSMGVNNFINGPYDKAVGGKSRIGSTEGW